MELVTGNKSVADNQNTTTNVNYFRL